ncbi:FK506-binding protein 4 [Diplonema papillatum]|nr:FK506-binding protein 4 [Diplonema papillatum]
MGFFGLQVQSGKAYDVKVPKGKQLALNVACIDASEPQPVSLVATVDGRDIIIASLNKHNCMAMMRLHFDSTKPLAFSIRGHKTVHISGNFQEEEDPLEFGFDMDDDEEDEEMDEEEEAELRAAVLSVANNNNKKPGKRQREEVEEETAADAKAVEEETQRKTKKKKKKKNAAAQ